MRTIPSATRTDKGKLAFVLWPGAAALAIVLYTSFANDIAGAPSVICLLPAVTCHLGPLLAQHLACTLGPGAAAPALRVGGNGTAVALCLSSASDIAGTPCIICHLGQLRAHHLCINAARRTRNAAQPIISTADSLVPGLLGSNQGSADAHTMECVTTL